MFFFPFLNNILLLAGSKEADGAERPVGTEVHLPRLGDGQQLHVVGPVQPPEHLDQLGVCLYLDVVVLKKIFKKIKKFEKSI
jgi:hypothetical protein